MKSRGKLNSGPTPSFPSCFRIAKNELSVLIFCQWLRKSSVVSLNYPIYTFSSAEVSLCCRKAGEREERRRTGIPRGPPFHSPHHPPRACYFSITVIFIRIPSESLRGGENNLHKMKVEKQQIHNERLSLSYLPHLVV